MPVGAFGTARCHPVGMCGADFGVFIRKQYKIFKYLDLFLAIRSEGQVEGQAPGIGACLGDCEIARRLSEEGSFWCGNTRKLGSVADLIGRRGRTRICNY
jgi:hypothetical protein